VTEFEFTLPFRSRQDPLDVEALDAASQLEGDDRAIAEGRGFLTCADRISRRWWTGSPPLI
jgi:hypothetical protein